MPDRAQPSGCRSRHVTLRLCAAALLLSASPLVAQRQALDDAVTALAAEQVFPGFCTAVVDRDSTRYLRAAGFADRAAGRPYTVRTVQPVGSVSKTLIGVVLAQLTADGRLSLDTTVAALLPPALRGGVMGARITLRHLATHTSGLRDDEARYATAYQPATARDTGFVAWMQQYLHAGAPAPATGDAPGARFAYSNVGAALAALALELQQGTPYATLVQRAVFTPLGLTQSRFSAVPDSLDAVLYDDALRPVPPYALVTYPDGGWRTSCADLARYVQGVLQAADGRAGAILTRSAAQAMLAPQFTAAWRPADQPPREPNQGLFWQHRATGGVGHSGSDPGVTAFVLLDPAAGTGRVFMTNTELTERTPARVARFTALWRAAASYQASLSGTAR